MRTYAINCLSNKFFHYRYATKRILLNNQAWKVLNASSGKQYLSTVIRVGGCSNYEEQRLSRNLLVVPEKFNFASDVIDEWAQKEREGLRPSAVPALWYVYDNGKEVKFSYEELEYRTKKLASILQQHCGVKRGEYAIVMLPKIPEFWLVSIAAIRIGFVFAPTNIMMTAKDLEHRFKSLEPSTVIAHESVTDIIEEATKSISSLKNKIVISEKPNRKSGWFDLNHFQSEATNHECASTRSDEPMMVYFTSGTTGHPKMVEHTQASFGFSIRDYGRYGLDLTPENMVWGMADTGWSFAAYNFLGAWSMGGGLFIHQMSKFSPKKTIEVLVKYPIDTLASAPLVYSSLLMENLEENKFRKLEYCVSGGDTLSKEVAEKFLARTGLLLYNGYGQSETTALIGQQKCFEYRFGSMGKPFPGVDAFIVDENENIVGPGVPGEIVIDRKKYIGLFKGYKNNPEANKAAFTDKYYHTSDVGYYDKDGYFWFVGRKDDVINSAGYRIGPTEVEDAILEHSAVSEVAVVESPDKDRGVVVKAFIILNSSAEPSEKLIKEIQEHCKRTTAPYKYPRKIEFVKELPRSASGKVKRSLLKKREKEEALKN